MRQLVSHISLLIYVVFALSFAASANAGPTDVFVNRINGQVYDDNHRPVPDLHVELLDELNTTLARTRTNAAGAFTFLGVSSGHFQVRVVTFGTGLIGETKDVQVTPMYANGSDSVYVDFYLKYDKRVSPIPTGPGEAIFVQDVPVAAKTMFEDGVAKIQRGQPEAALKDLEAALDVFPLYFDALSVLGRQLVKQEKFAEGSTYLLRAVDVNQRSASVYYSLAVAFYRLRHVPDATKAVDAAILLNGGSAEAHLLRGTILRESKSYKDAEASLQKALSIDKKSAEAHYQLALLCNRTNRNAEAIDHLQQYVKLSSDATEKKNAQDLIAKLKASEAKNGAPLDKQ